MAYKYYNPIGIDTGDCVVRALSKALNQSWDITYWDLCTYGFSVGDWGNSNRVWDAYLRDNGFKRRVIPDTCPDCYTIKDFCEEHPYGVYVLATGDHAVAAIDGSYYDSFDSGSLTPIFYYERRI